MKTLLTYVLVASMGLVTTCSFATAQEERVNFVASLKTLPLEDNDFDKVGSRTEPVIPSKSHHWSEKKQSLIYYINISEAIDSAIGQQYYSKNWIASLWLSSSPDQIKLKSLRSQAANFRNALMIDVRETKVTTKGEYQLSLNAKASIKLPSLKQEIGEYHHQRMIGTFAVFR